MNGEVHTYLNEMYYLDENGHRLYVSELFHNQEFVKIYQKTLKSMAECRRLFLSKMPSMGIERSLAPCQYNPGTDMSNQLQIKIRTNDTTRTDAHGPFKFLDSEAKFFQVSCCDIGVSSHRIEFQGNLISFRQGVFVIEKHSTECKTFWSMLQEMYSMLQGNIDVVELHTREKSDQFSVEEKNDINGPLKKFEKHSAHENLEKKRPITSESNVWRRRFQDRFVIPPNDLTQKASILNNKISTSIETMYNRKKSIMNSCITAKRSNIPVRIKIAHDL